MGFSFFFFSIYILYFLYFSIAHTALEEHQSAYECYRKALELDPDNQSYQNNLEIAEQKLKDAALQVSLSFLILVKSIYFMVKVIFYGRIDLPLIFS